MTTILQVAGNMDADLETRQLGEDAWLIEAANTTFDNLSRYLEIIQPLLRNEDARRRTSEFYSLLHSARHDSSWGGLVELARDARIEAGVVKIKEVV